MAHFVDVIRTYRPEVVLEKPVEAEEFQKFLVEKSGLEAEPVGKVLGALSEAAFWFLVRGRPLPLPGVGSLQPTIRWPGRLSAELAADGELEKRMNAQEAYRGGIRRRENLGVPVERLVQMWNSSHPDDPVLDFPQPAGASG